MKSSAGFRKYINVIHLWVGVPCALILFIVCLTGTTYVFQKEIVRWVDGDKFRLSVPAGAQMLPAEQLVEKLEKEKPGLKVTSVQIPGKTDEAWMFTMAPGGRIRAADATIRAADATKPRGKKQTRIFLVNPYTGAIQGDAQTTAYKFFDTVIELHRWLLMDHTTGAVITGTSAMLFVLLELTGLMLWMPAKLRSWKNRNAWKPGFTVKLKAGWKRVNHDLHKTLGFYTFIIITVLGLTGPYFGFEWYRSGFTKLFGAKVPKKEAAADMAKMKSATPVAVPLQTVLTTTNITFPYDGDLRINFPKDGSTTVTALKTRTGFFASASTDRAYFDAASGSMTRVERFGDKKAGEKIVGLVRAIHTGEIFGTFSKILYFLACLIATSLPVTGVMIWLNKRKGGVVRKKVTPQRKKAGADLEAKVVAQE